MDKFEDANQKMEKMKPDEIKKTITNYRSSCLCGRCPTYNDCMRQKNELLFCLIGKSLGCTIEMKGCICPTCPVTSVMGLRRAYFCIRGSEKEQRRRK